MRSNEWECNMSAPQSIRGDTQLQVPLSGTCRSRPRWSAGGCGGTQLVRINDFGRGYPNGFAATVLLPASWRAKPVRALDALEIEPSPSVAPSSLVVAKASSGTPNHRRDPKCGPDSSNATFRQQARQPLALMRPSCSITGQHRSPVRAPGRPRLCAPRSGAVPSADAGRQQPAQLVVREHRHGRLGDRGRAACGPSGRLRPPPPLRASGRIAGGCGSGWRPSTPAQRT